MKLNSTREYKETKENLDKEIIESKEYLNELLNEIGVKKKQLETTYTLSYSFKENEEESMMLENEIEYQTELNDKLIKENDSLCLENRVN